MAKKQTTEQAPTPLTGDKLVKQLEKLVAKQSKEIDKLVKNADDAFFKGQKHGFKAAAGLIKDLAMSVKTDESIEAPVKKEVLGVLKDAQTDIKNLPLAC